MGKRTKLREAQSIAIEQALAARLRDHKRTHSQALTWCDLEPYDIARLGSYWDLAVRKPQDWRGSPRLRDTGSRLLDFVRFVFTDYPVPRILEQAWLADGPGAGAPDFCYWYIMVGRGFSLYREGGGEWLSRAELHRFLNAPSAVGSPQAATWYAVALPHAARPKVAIKIARSGINRFPSSSGYWRAAACFLARNPTHRHEMTELISFLRECERAGSPFALEGRTLESLRVHVRRWRQRAWILPRSWAGCSVPNREYVVDGAIWRFRQIRSDHQLFEEGWRMHHCVGIYANACAHKKMSVWSVSRLHQGRAQPLLTIAVEATGVISQVRGFANRAPTAFESDVVWRWAQEFNLEWPLGRLAALVAAE